MISSRLPRGLLALLVAAPLAAQAPPPPRMEERIEIRGRGWGVAERREYTLVFDSSPFGRQGIRLRPIGRTEDGRLYRIFETDGNADLRASGGSGGLFWQAEAALDIETGRPARVMTEDSWRPRAGFEPDRERAARGARARTFQAVFPPGKAEIQIDLHAGGQSTRDVLSTGPLDGAVDLRLPVQWGPIVEELELAEGQERTLRLFLLAPSFRLDYHLDASEPGPVSPQVREVVLRGGPVEAIRVGGRSVSARRIEVHPLGIVLWRSEDGVLQKVDTGWGMTLELRERSRLGS